MAPAEDGVPEAARVKSACFSAECRAQDLMHPCAVAADHRDA
jgi:hypothetical protein